jgi:hypothetical protein
MKQRLDSPLREYRGREHRKIRVYIKRYLGRANRWETGFKGVLIHEMYTMGLDFIEEINSMLWSPRRPRTYRRRAK